MSTPMKPAELLAQLKKWDVPYREIKGWRHHERDQATGLDFGPVYGCMTHHTGDDAPDNVDRRVIRDGRSDLPGPLAHFGLNDDGVLDIHSIGRANHAGGGDPRVLRAVIAESYGKFPPKTHFHQGEPGSTDGNDHFYGCEVYYSGRQKMTNKAYRTLVRLWAAICDFHGWTAKSVIGHKEWSDWKSDPASQSMHSLRLDVDAMLAAGPGQPVLKDTRVTKIGEMLDEVLDKLAEVPESRTLVQDIEYHIGVQRARLPER